MMLRIAAQYADSWSSWGGYQIETEAQMFAATQERCARFGDLCVSLNRDPTTIRHSLVCYPPLTPWESVQHFVDMIGRYRELGIDEFVLYWPNAWREHSRRNHRIRNHRGRDDPRTTARSDVATSQDLELPRSGGQRPTERTNSASTRAATGASRPRSPNSPARSDPQRDTTRSRDAAVRLNATEPRGLVAHRFADRRA